MAALVAVVVLGGLMVAVAAALDAGPFARGGGVDEALAVLPAGTDHVLVGDRAAAAGRLDLPDGEEDDEAGERALLDDAPWAASPLAGSVPEGGDAPVRDADVAWWALADSMEFGESTVLGLADDVDPEQVVASLEDAGWAETADSTEGRPSLELEVGEVDPAAASLPWAAVTLDIDRGLLLAGSPDAVFGVLDGSAESLADAGTYDGVVGPDRGTELAVLDTALSLCDSSLGARSTPESEASAAAELGDLGRPDAAGTVVAADGDGASTTSRLRFDDDGAAEADAAVRETYLAESELSDVDVTADGEVVTVDFTYPDPGAAVLRQEALQRRVPLASQCPPAA